MNLSSALRARLGWPTSETERTLWLVGDSMAAFEAMAPTLEAVANRYRRLGILLSAPDTVMRARLASRFPLCRVLPPPFNNTVSVGRFLQRCNVRLALFVEPRAELPEALLAGLDRRAVSVVAATARHGETFAPGPRLRASCAACLEIGETTPRAGPGEAGRRRVSPEKAVDVLGAMLARDLKPIRHSAVASRGPGAMLVALARDPRRHRLISWRIRRFASLAQLDEALGAPRTILCLGNGPSSEDPALTGYEYDALFRVNHSWLSRRRFVDPDVVFTGGKSTMRAARNAILGLQTQDAEERFAMLRAFSPTGGPARFFNVNDMTDALRAFPWGPFRPTNGAAMLAVAVALQPARLIVAGIDLFQHREGTYPSDTTTPNDYSPGHSLESELSLLLELFAKYRGELIIVGNILRTEWEKVRSRPSR